MYGIGSSDYYRTRLTHSLEVAQIGKAIAQNLGANSNLVEAICLAHDIGHPPFGHAGEAELHSLLRNNGGFNGNAQNITIVTKFERKSPDYEGLNLTAATLDGLVKYPFILDPLSPADSNSSVKGYYAADAEVVAAFKPDMSRKTFECQIMDWSDDIAYSSHDLEDALVIGTIGLEDLTSDERKSEIMDAAMRSYRKDYPDLEYVDPLSELDVHTELGGIVTGCVKIARDKRLATIKTFIGQHIGRSIRLVSAVSSQSPSNSESYGLTRYEKSLVLDSTAVKRVEIYKAITMTCVIKTTPVLTLQHGGRLIVRQLFESLTDSKNDELQFYFPIDIREEYSRLSRLRASLDTSARSEGHEAEVRASDRAMSEFGRNYVASLTDHAAEELWRRMFSIGQGLFSARL